ncbi:MAG: prepilin-type N-terminal cleavage/methylation domain-containing protein [Phycisphaerales bacterium]
MNTALRTNANARAFTLVEVLVGILILGLGLLGLGAIYPAVAIQQRGAGDAVEGQAVADAAEAFFKGNAWLNYQSVPAPDAPTITQGTPVHSRTIGGWEVALFADGGTRGLDPVGQEWSTVEPGNNPPLISYDITNNFGQMRIGAQTLTGTEVQYYGAGEMAIDVQERLLPRRDTGATTLFGNARFVWDAVARRIPKTRVATPGETPMQRIRRHLQDAVQVAVFVRRIDPGIRNRSGQQYVPVAQTAEGLAALDGVGSFPLGNASGVPNYSPIRRMELTPVAEVFFNSTIPPDAMIRYVRLTDGSVSNGMTRANVNAAIAQVGQKFVLGDGTVVTVRGVEHPAGVDYSVLRINPEVPNASFDPTGQNSMPALFTAQVPVAVRVINLHTGGAL